MTVRHLRSYASWVNTVVRQVVPYPDAPRDKDFLDHRYLDHYERTFSGP